MNYWWKFTKIYDRIKVSNLQKKYTEEETEPASEETISEEIPEEVPGEEIPEEETYDKPAVVYPENDPMVIFGRYQEG